MVDLSITILISLDMYKHGLGHIEIIHYALLRIRSLQSQLQFIIRQVDQNISVVLFFSFPAVLTAGMHMTALLSPSGDVGIGLV